MLLLYLTLFDIATRITNRLVGLSNREGIERSKWAFSL